MIIIGNWCTGAGLRDPGQAGEQERQQRDHGQVCGLPLRGLRVREETHTGDNMEK